MKVLITLGPTQEPLDAVRYITNSSSGKMGRALAQEALERDFTTTLISGPVEIELPSTPTIPVKTAPEMMDKTLEELKKDYDLFISTAAIADYSPEKKEGKINSEQEEINLTLKRNPKLTRQVREKFPDLYLVAFKAEYGLPKDKLVKKSFEKMINEDLNMVVANDLKKNPFGSDHNEVYLVEGNSVEHFGKASKRELAKKIWKEILQKNEG